MKYLVVRCHAGLGNRIRALVAGQRLAKKTGRQLAIQWVIDPYHCGCDFNALFDTPHLLVGDVDGVTESYTVKMGPNFIAESGSDVIHVLEENFFWSEIDRPRKVVWGQFGPSQVSDDTLRSELLDEFASLRPNPYVLRETEEFWSNIDSPVVALHVRRGDNDWSNAYCKDEMFLPPLLFFLRSNPRAKILLCTDGEESRKFFLRQFPKSIVEYKVRSLDRGGDWRAVQDAFITMLLMSKCELIIRSVSSTFSQCAAWFGNVPVLGVGPLQNKQ